MRAYEINVEVRQKIAEKKGIVELPELEEYYLLEDFGIGIFEENTKFVEKILLIQDIIRTYRESKK